MLTTDTDNIPMKKIKLNETDLMKIVKRVLNEQKDRQFNENEIELLHFIFERELKPPFVKGEKDVFGHYPYYNSDNKVIGWLQPQDKEFIIMYDPIWINIKDKVCQVFGIPLNTIDWWNAIEPHLKSWLGDQIDVKLSYIILP